MTAIVDFFSMSWCPSELARILDAAKSGASIKAMRFFDHNSYGDAITELVEDTGLVDYKRIIAEMLNKAEFEFNSDTRKNNYHQCKSDLLNHFGLNTLDCLCRGEIERFVNRFNYEFGDLGNEWTLEHKSGGFSGYSNFANILVNGQQAGKCAWGAKNHGCFFSLSGVGCSAVNFERLYLAIRAIPAVKITRVDLAYDSLKGKHNIKVARKFAKNGEFTGKGRPPSYCYIESGHLFAMGSRVNAAGNVESLKKRYGFCPDKGKTFYIGSRDGGKMLRVYEKGKQLESKEYPNWVRWEVELRAKDRIIPLDVLIKPSDYLAASYPALQFVNHVDLCPIATNKSKYFTTVDNAISNGARQCGKLVNFLRQVMDLKDEQIVNYLTRHLDDFEIPDRLKTPIWKETLESKKIQFNLEIQNRDNSVCLV